MREQLQALYNFEDLTLERLNGYDNINYLLTTGDKRYIFKTYTYEEELLALIEAENDALLFLQKTPQSTYPRPIPCQDRSYVKVVTFDGKPTIIRLLTYLEGSFLGDLPLTPDIAASLGTLLAKTDLLLKPYVNYTIKARTLVWDIQQLDLSKPYLAEIPDPTDRSLVEYFFQQYHENVLPVLPLLPKSIIHNDANEWNVLVNETGVCGLIDFGDLAHTPHINGVAIALTYLCYDKDEPLPWVPHLLKAYHEVSPLEEQELSVLYYLIAARLCISVCQSAHAKNVNPENTYTSISERSAWKMLRYWISVNPVHARNYFFTAVGYRSPEVVPIQEKVLRRHRVISPLISLSYATPIPMERAAFQYMYDSEGNTFLDAYNNIPHVGHGHPRVVAAGQRQMAKLNTNTRYVYDLLAEYAERLLAKFPKALNKVYFVNSGSAASDLAIRLALAHTGHKQLMVMEHGYHGNTQLGIDISDYKFSNKKGQGQKEYILKAPLPDTYRGEFRTNDGSAGANYARQAIRLMEESEYPVAAFITEPIVGCGGQVPLAKEYLKHLYPAIRKQGGICISDEVQTGFGRVGDHFWGYEAQEVIPDLVILGKPMGNGHPMGAVVTTTEIAESFGKGVEFFSSFGGNPVSCAIGLSVLDVIEEENLQENARQVGNHYQSLLRELQTEFPVLSDVRGSGLFLGVEVVKPNSMEPDPALAAFIKNELRNNHILISTDGPYDSVLKSKPPLCFTKQNAERVVEEIGKALRGYSKF